MKGVPFGDFGKNHKLRFFEQCHSAKKCKRGDPLGFFSIHSVAKYCCKKKQMKGDPLVQSKIFLEKIS